MPNPAFQALLSEIQCFAESTSTFQALQEFTVHRIPQRLPYYNWVGFYMLDAQDPNILVLGPYSGVATEHVRIPVTQGICGAAVAQGETIIVEDVSSDPRYLSCSIKTRSEIVVPIRAGGEIVGEIDVDSHTLNAFTAEDRIFLEECAHVFGEAFERTSSKSAAQ